MRFRSVAGEEGIDFSSQLLCSNLRHPSDRVVDAVEQQVGDTADVAPSYTTEARAKLGTKLAELTSDDLSKPFVSTSAAESIEATSTSDPIVDLFVDHLERAVVDSFRARWIADASKTTDRTSYVV